MIHSSEVGSQIGETTFVEHLIAVVTSSAGSCHMPPPHSSDFTSHAGPTIYNIKNSDIMAVRVLASEG